MCNNIATTSNQQSAAVVAASACFHHYSYRHYATFIVCLDAQSLTRTIPEVVATATSVDQLVTELQLPDNQVLALFNKAVRKLCNALRAVQEKGIEAEINTTTVVLLAACLAFCRYVMRTRRCQSQTNTQTTLRFDCCITTAAKTKAMVAVGDNMHMVPQTMAQELEDGAKQAMNKMKGKTV
eukprot:1016-Heterococcus_DN1.PRE.1